MACKCACPVEEIVQKLKQQGINYVQFMFTDIKGKLCAMEEAVDSLPHHAAHGVGVDGSSVAGFTRVNRSDVKLVPDMSTFATYVLGGTRIARVLCDVHFDGKPHPGCVRSALKSVIARAEAMGFNTSMFGELEWYFLNAADRSPHDTAGYCSLAPEDKALNIRHKLGNDLELAGCVVKRIHHENGPGQNEVELKLTPSLKNSDDLVTAMSIIQTHAHANGLVAEFSPKPLPNEAGSGYHQHSAVYDIKTGKNIFGNDPAGTVSEQGKHFIGGLLAHAREITAVFARSDESFVRLQPGHEAPCVAAWGYKNRTALVRIPELHDPQDTRIEFRAGDISGCTYLMCAAIMAAGLDGIAKKMACPEPTGENADNFTDADLKKLGFHRLPSTHAETQEILKTSEWLRQTLGTHIVEYLMSHW